MADKEVAFQLRNTVMEILASENDGIEERTEFLRHVQRCNTNEQIEQAISDKAKLALDHH